jgi:hypothetical protein
VDENTYGVIAIRRYIFFRFRGHTDGLRVGYSVEYYGDLLLRGGVDFDYMDTGLDTFDDFLYIGANAHEMDIVFVFVDIIAEYLLALFVYIIEVVYHNHLFFPLDSGVGLTEGFHFIAEIVDALFFQIVDYEDVCFWYGVGF